MNIEQIVNKLNDLDVRLSEIEQNRSPESVFTKLSDLTAALEYITLTLQEHSNKFKAMDNDDAYIEEFDDERLRQWYDISGLMSKEVQAFIEKILGREITPSAVSQYLNGQIGDVRVRSKLGKWFRTNAIKKNPTIAVKG